MKLSIKAFSLTCGISWGLTVFISTLWLYFGGFDGHLIKTLDHFYFGYSFSLPGAFIGLAWGFVDGLLGGAIFAWLYNKFAG